MDRLPLSESSLEAPYRQQLIDALDDYRFRPGGAAYRFIEQRRLAIVVDEILPGFRDLIHDRVPTADRVIDSMVAYYDAPSEQNRRAVLVAYSVAEQLLSRNSLIDRKMIGDYEVYNQPVGDSGDRKPMIDVLRAMQQYRAVELVPPGDIMAMAEYDKVTRRDRYEYAGALERLTGAVNEVLRDAMHNGDGYSDDTMSAVCQELSDMTPCIAARKTAELVTLISGEDMVRHRRRGEASRAGALWSGSVAGQLQQLVQPRQLTYAANKPRHGEWLQRMQYPSE